MEICHSCQFSNPAGTVMCNQCQLPLGQSQVAPVQLTPPNAGVQAHPMPGQPVPIQAYGGLASPSPKACHIRWSVLENLQPTGQSLQLPDLNYEGEILLGRNDLENQIIVDIDLSAFDGFEKRVSRQHARLCFERGSIFIQDWKSQYGTYVNKQRLKEQERQLINAGDEIRLAQLIFSMEVI